MEDQKDPSKQSSESDTQPSLPDVRLDDVSSETERPDALEDLLPPATVVRRRIPLSTPKKIGFIFGWILLLAAFAAGSAETVVRVNPDYNSGIISAHDLWYTLDPSGLVGLEIKLERVAPILWDPIATTVLALPAWVLCLLPGALLLWTCWPRQLLNQDELDELADREATLFLYDDLAREAEAEGFNADGMDDMSPIHEKHHYLDEAGVTHAEGERAFDISLENDAFDLPLSPENDVSSALPPGDPKG